MLFDEFCDRNVLRHGEFKDFQGCGNWEPCYNGVMLALSHEQLRNGQR